MSDRPTNKDRHDLDCALDGDHEGPCSYRDRPTDPLDGPSRDIPRKDARCPTCGSPDPSIHVKVKGPGFIHYVCTDPFHTRPDTGTSERSEDVPERCPIPGCGHAWSMHNSLGYCRSRTTPNRKGECMCDSGTVSGSFAHADGPDTGTDKDVADDLGLLRHDQSEQYPTRCYDCEETWPCSHNEALDRVAARLRTAEQERDEAIARAHRIATNADDWRSALSREANAKEQLRTAEERAERLERERDDARSIAYRELRWRTLTMRREGDGMHRTQRLEGAEQAERALRIAYDLADGAGYVADAVWDELAALATSPSDTPAQPQEGRTGPTDEQIDRLVRDVFDRTEKH